MADDLTTTPGGSNVSSTTNPPQTGGSDGGDTPDKQDETQSYTIKSVNTGLVGKHVRENVEVDGKPYGVGDEVELTEVAHKSLVDMGVKFE